MYTFILLKFNARDISPVVASRKRNPKKTKKIITSNSCAETKFSHDVINIFGSTRKFIIILLCYVFLLLQRRAVYAPTKIKKLSRHKNKFRLSCFRYPRGESLTLCAEAWMWTQTCKFVKNLKRKTFIELELFFCNFPSFPLHLQVMLFMSKVGIARESNLFLLLSFSNRNEKFYTCCDEPYCE